MISPTKKHLSPKGMTLLELTVVIVVLLGLIGVTFVGAQAWKRGSDRAMSILLIRSAQMGMRAHCQVEGITEATYTDMPEAVFGKDKYVANGIDRSTGLQKPVGALPDHPSKNFSFDFVSGDGDIIPPQGQLYICTGGGGSIGDLTYNPKPSRYAQW